MVLKKYGGGSFVRIPKNQKDIEIQAKAIDYVISKTNYAGLNVPSDAMSKLPNGRASYYYWYGNNEEPPTIGYNSPQPPNVTSYGSPAWTTSKKYPENETITFLLTTSYVNTVENLQNIWIHEFVGHFVKGFFDKNKEHYKAYDLQISHLTFEKCTTDLKKLLLKNRDEYYRCEVLNQFDTCKNH